MAGRLEKTTNVAGSLGVIGQRCAEWAQPPNEDGGGAVGPPNPEHNPCRWRPSLLYIYAPVSVCRVVEGVVRCFTDVPAYAGITSPGTYVVEVTGCEGTGTAMPILPYRVT
jgi:hypothetical protein